MDSSSTRKTSVLIKDERPQKIPVSTTHQVACRNQTILFKFDDLSLWIEKNNPDKG